MSIAGNPADPLYERQKELGLLPSDLGGLRQTRASISIQMHEEKKRNFNEELDRRETTKLKKKFDLTVVTDDQSAEKLMQSELNPSSTRSLIPVEKSHPLCDFCKQLFTGLDETQVMTEKKNLLKKKKAFV